MEAKTEGKIIKVIVTFSVHFLLLTVKISTAYPEKKIVENIKLEKVLQILVGMTIQPRK